MQLIGGEKGVDFELYLVEELAVAIVILDNAKGLLFVHLVLLNLLYFVLLIFVQYVALELKFVLLHLFNIAHAVVEVGRHEPLKVCHVHEFGLNRLHHFLVKV